MADDLHKAGLLSEYVGRPLITFDIPPSYSIGFGNLTLGRPLDPLNLENNNPLVTYIEELEDVDSLNIKYDRVFHFWVLDRDSQNKFFGPYYLPYVHKVEKRTVKNNDDEDIEVTDMTLRPLREVINPRFNKLGDDLYEMVFLSSFSSNVLPDDEYTDDSNYLIRQSEFSTNYPENILKGEAPVIPEGDVEEPTDNTLYFYPDESEHHIGNPRTAALSCLIRFGIMEIDPVYESGSGSSTSSPGSSSTSSSRVKRIYAICEKPRIISWLDYRYARDSYPSLIVNRAQSLDWLSPEQINDSKFSETPSKQIPENHLITGIEANMYHNHIGYDFETMPINHFYQNSLRYVLEIKRVGEVDPHPSEYTFHYDNFRPDSIRINVLKMEWRTVTAPNITIKNRKFGSAVGDPYAYSYIDEEYLYPLKNTNAETHFIVLYIEYETLMDYNLYYYLCNSSSSCAFYDCDCCHTDYEVSFDYECVVRLQQGGFFCGEDIDCSGSATIPLSRVDDCTYFGEVFDEDVPCDDEFNYLSVQSTSQQTLIINHGCAGAVTATKHEIAACCIEGSYEDLEVTEIGPDDCERITTITNITVGSPQNKIEECCWEFEVIYDCENEEWGDVEATEVYECDCLCETDWEIDSQTSAECRFIKYVKSGSCANVTECSENSQPPTPSVPDDTYLNFCDCVPCRCHDGAEFSLRQFIERGIVSIDDVTYSDSIYYLYDPCNYCNSVLSGDCDLCVFVDLDGGVYWALPNEDGSCPDPYIINLPDPYLEDYLDCQHSLLNSSSSSAMSLIPGSTFTVDVFDPPYRVDDPCRSYDISVRTSLGRRLYSCGQQSSSMSSRMAKDGYMAPIMGRPLESIDPSHSYKFNFFNKTIYSPLEKMDFDSRSSISEFEEDFDSVPILQYDRILHFWMIEGGGGKDVHGPFYVPYIDKMEAITGPNGKAATKYTLKPLREVINPHIEEISNNLYVMYFFTNMIYDEDSSSSSSSSSGSGSGSASDVEYSDSADVLKRMHEFAVNDPRFINPYGEIPERLASSSSYRLLPLDNIRNYHKDGMPEIKGYKSALCACILRIHDFDVPKRSSSSSSDDIKIFYPICEKPQIIEYFEDRYVTDFVQPLLVNRTQSIKWARDVYDSQYVDPRARDENPPKQMYHHDVISSIEAKMYPGFSGLEFGVKPITDVYKDSLYHVFLIEDENGEETYYREIDLDYMFTDPKMKITGFEFMHSADPCALDLPGIFVYDDESQNTPDAKTNTHYVVIRVLTEESVGCENCTCGSSSLSSLNLTTDCCSGDSNCVEHDWDSTSPPVTLEYGECGSVDFFLTNVVGKNDRIINIAGTVSFDQEIFSSSVPGIKIGYPTPVNVASYGSDGELYCLSLSLVQKQNNIFSGCGSDEDWRIFIEAKLSEGNNVSIDSPCDCSESIVLYGEYSTYDIDVPGEGRIDGYVTDHAESLLTVDGTGSMIVVWKTNGLSEGCAGCLD
jgi:hypothetical protein